MEIETKKTVLDDEASIYQKRKNEYTKEDFKSLSTKEKISYFKEYYLKISIIALVIIIAAGILIKDIFFDRSAPVLYVSCVNECRVGDTNKVADELKAYIQPENKKDFVSVIDYDLNIAQFNMSFVTLLNAGTIDLVICPYDYYLEAAGAGYFVDLSTFLSEDVYSSLSDKIVTASLTDTDIDGNVLEYSERYAFGIDISDNEHFSSLSESDGQVVLCVVNGTLNSENAKKAITYFTNMEK